MREAGRIEAALKAGHTVVGTVRPQDDMIAFEALHHKRAKAVIRHAIDDRRPRSG